MEETHGFILKNVNNITSKVISTCYILHISIYDFSYNICFKNIKPNVFILNYSVFIILSGNINKY